MRQSRGLNPQMADGLTSEEDKISVCEPTSHDKNRAVIAVWIEPRYPNEYIVDALVHAGRFYSLEHAMAFLRTKAHPILQPRLLQLSYVFPESGYVPLVLVRSDIHYSRDLQWTEERVLTTETVLTGTSVDDITRQYPRCASCHYRVLWLPSVTT